MAQITPTPDAGTWLEIVPGASFTEQPDAGSWLEISPYGEFENQPRAGTWLEVVPGWRRRGGIYVDGAVHF